MKGLKIYAFKEELMPNFPIVFKYIHYWKFEDDPKRIDNYDDPYFDGLESKKYQTSAIMPIGHYKPISKSFDMSVFKKNKDEK